MDEFTCSLCYKLLCNPVSIRCGHTFCNVCISKAANKFKKCPICLVALSQPLVLSTTYVLQAYLEKNFKEEYQQRLLEEQKEEEMINHSAKRVLVVSLPKAVYFPGTRVRIALDNHRLLHLIQEAVNENKPLAIVSEVLNEYIGILVQVTLCYFNGGRLFIQGLCTARIEVNYLYKYQSAEESFHIDAIRAAHELNVSPWQTDINIVQDIQVEQNKELEDRLLAFTEQCRRQLSGQLNNTINEGLTHPIKPSFYMLTVLKIPINEKLQAFKTNNNYERLEIIEKFIMDKIPSKDCLNVPLKKESSAYPLILVAAILFLIFAKFNQS